MILDFGQFLFCYELMVVRSSFFLFVSVLAWLDRNLMPGPSPPFVISPISYTLSIVVRTYWIVWFVLLVCIAGSIGECCESVW